VKRGSPTLWDIAVPASVLQLLAEEPIEQPIAGLTEISAKRENRTVDAGLDFALEERRVAEFREALSRGREVLASVVVVALARLGAHDPATAATAVAACFESLLLHRIARHDETDPRPAFELVVRAALA
jgi:hypothetical protein